MEHVNKVFCLELRGNYACFTRPEMKVERVSYDLITPSAARAVFEAIFWKPAVRWVIQKIEVLEPIRWTSVRRNEVGSVMSDRSDGIFIEEARQQRAGLFLRDVKYRVHAELDYLPPGKRPAERKPRGDTGADPEEERIMASENPGKYNAIFERRARKGQCFNQPYLGCREFSCAFRLVDDPAAEAPAIDETRDLGFMLYDLDYSEPKDIRPVFFRARLERGVMKVPDWGSEEVRR